MAACQSAQLHRLCTQTFIDALAVEPDFIKNRRPNPRFVAACAASALATCRENDNRRDATIPDSNALRELTCQWLMEVLEDQVRHPPPSSAGQRWLSREFTCWQHDPGLADLRDAARLDSNRAEFSRQCAAL